MLSSKQIVQIRELLENSQNPLFFFDNDTDGLISFLLFQRFLGRGKGIAIKTFPALSVDYSRKFHEHKPDVIFILDKPSVEEAFFEEAVKLGIRIVWIDHHKPELENLNLIEKYTIFYFNPLLGTPETPEPVSYWCQKVVKKDEWLALFGCIGDWFLPEWTEEIAKKYPDLFPSEKISPARALYETKMGKLSRILNFALMDRTSEVVKMIKFLFSVKTPYELLDETKPIYKRAMQIDKKYELMLEKAKEIAKKQESVVFFKYGGELSLSGMLSNEIFYLFPNKTIIIAYVKGGKANISLRGKLNLRDLMPKFLENVEGSGGGHCLTGDTLVILHDGSVVGIKDKQKELLSMNFKTFKTEIAKCSRISHHNDLTIYEINAPPYSIRTSGRHTFFKFDRNKITTVLASRLKKGDLLLAVRKIKVNTGLQNLPDMNKEIAHAIKVGHRYKEITFPKKLNKKICQILGYLIGDGNIYNHDQIEFRDQDYNLLKSYQNLIKNIFNIEGKISRIRGKRAYRYRLFSSILAKFFEKIIGGWQRLKNIPLSIMKSPDRELAAFFRGFYDAEANIGDHEIFLAQSNPELLRKAQLLLLRFGIISSIRRNMLAISSYDSIKTFKKYISFVSNKKQKRLYQLISRLETMKRSSNLGYAPVSYVQLKDLLKEKNIDLHNAGLHRHPDRPVTLRTFRKIIRRVGGKYKNIPKLMQKLLEGDLMLLKISIIRQLKNKELLYDLTVPSHHNFIAGGLLVHNSHAVGATINPDDLQKFVENVKKYI